MSRQVQIGNLKIGGGAKIAVQSMTTCRLCEEEKAISSVLELERAGCDIVRFSVLDFADAKAISTLKKHVSAPIVADIHFDYKLAIESIKYGADKIRINPGNIGSDENVKKVADALKSSGIAVRVGSNTGSIEKEFLSKYGRNEIALVESALKHVSTLEKHGVENIVISVKASSVPLMVKAYRYIAQKTDYPLHLGVTEAGTEYSGIIKNSMGIGALLLDGIGDTIRVSLSADPVREVLAGRTILKGLNLLDEGAEVVACPTCGRCQWDCMSFAKRTEEYLQGVKKKIKVAVMGCAVNGPGEASDADIGIAGGKDGCVIFVGGKIVKKVNEKDAEKEFFSEIDKCIQ
jgi:(E)-4-hydroxy-3-methylbut-2-enyl-diphosphate synthase